MPLDREFLPITPVRRLTLRIIECFFLVASSSSQQGQHAAASAAHGPWLLCCDCVVPRLAAVTSKHEALRVSYCCRRRGRPATAVSSAPAAAAAVTPGWRRERPCRSLAAESVHR
jgi:hypothetical protein